MLRAVVGVVGCGRVASAHAARALRAYVSTTSGDRHASHGSAAPDAHATASTTASTKRAIEPSASEPLGFIQKAKAAGASSLLGAFVTISGRFDSCMAGVEVVRIDDGFVRCALTVSNELTNSYGTLHGGAICTIVDVVGTLALLTKDATRAGVSVDINTTFCQAAKLGEKLYLEGRVLKTGKRLGFAEVDIVRQSDGTLIATGRHTKAL